MSRISRGRKYLNETLFFFYIHFKILLRLEHLFEAGEHPILSNPAEVDIADLFTTFDLTMVEEMTLGGNKPLSQVRKRLNLNLSNAFGIQGIISLLHQF